MADVENIKIQIAKKNQKDTFFKATGKTTDIKQFDDELRQFSLSQNLEYSSSLLTINELELINIRI